MIIKFKAGFESSFEESTVWPRTPSFHSQLLHFKSNLFTYFHVWDRAQTAALPGMHMQSYQQAEVYCIQPTGWAVIGWAFLWQTVFTLTMPWMAFISLDIIVHRIILIIWYNACCHAMEESLICKMLHSIMQRKHNKLS